MANSVIRSPRRAYTVPDELVHSYLPALSTKTQIPKRYEETKPVKVQNFTHRRIIDLGELINKRSLDEAENEKRMAVEQAVAVAWDQAASVREQAVLEAETKASVEQEKAIKKLQRSHARSIKEEAMKVEAKMQKKIREQIEAEKIAAQKKLEDTIEQVRQECHEQLLEAVRLARDEEKIMAQQQLEAVRDKFANELADVVSMMTTEKDMALKELASEKCLEKERAVAEAHTFEKEVAERKLEQLRYEQEQVVAALQKEITDREQKIVLKDDIIEGIEKKRQVLYGELLKLQEDYEHFVDKHPMFHSGQSGFLIPSLSNNQNVQSCKPVL